MTASVRERIIPCASRAALDRIVAHSMRYLRPVRRGVRATAEVYQEPLGTRSVYVSYAPGEEGELTQRELNEVTQQALDARYHSTPGETALEFLGIAAMAGVGWWALTGLSTLKK